MTTVLFFREKTQNYINNIICISRVEMSTQTSVILLNTILPSVIRFVSGNVIFARVRYSTKINAACILQEFRFSPHRNGKVFNYLYIDRKLLSILKHKQQLYRRNKIYDEFIICLNYLIYMYILVLCVGFITEYVVSLLLLHDIRPKMCKYPIVYSNVFLLLRYSNKSNRICKCNLQHLSRSIYSYAFDSTRFGK